MININVLSMIKSLSALHVKHLKETSCGQFQVDSFNEMTDCHSIVPKRLVSRSLVLELTRGPAASLCVIYEVFYCGVGRGVKLYQ